MCEHFKNEPCKCQEDGQECEVPEGLETVPYFNLMFATSLKAGVQVGKKFTCTIYKNLVIQGGFISLIVYNNEKDAMMQLDIHNVKELHGKFDCPAVVILLLEPECIQVKGGLWKFVVKSPE